MKIRTGFVSNSSSSSFCILGVVVGDKVTDEQYEAFDDLPYEKQKTMVLQSVRGIADYYEQNLLGVSPTDMKDEETLAQFKARIIAEFESAGITGLTVNDLDWHIDGGTDS